MPAHEARRDLVFDAWAHARANVNIALIKYWGKAPIGAGGPRADANLPAVPSLSLTLDGLFSETWARFAPDADGDHIALDGVTLVGEERARAVMLLDELRARTDIAAPFEVRSWNRVPTAAGLASSASGMAALAGAAGRCAGLLPERDGALLSELARVGSGSAARSVFGGWVAWQGRAALPIAPPEHVPIAVVVAVVGRGRKAVASRDGMNHTMRTSPYYGPWVQQAHASFDGALAALRDKDLPRLFAAMELSTWRMHASAMGADPAVFYWQPGSLAALAEVAALKAEGRVCGATLDAGPNVKVFCLPEDGPVIAERLATVPGVLETISAKPGAGIQVNITTDEPRGQPRVREAFDEPMGGSRG